MGTEKNDWDKRIGVPDNISLDKDRLSTTLPSDAMQFAELHQYKLEEHDEGGYIGINEKKFAELLEKYASAKIAEMEREMKADLRNKLSPFTNLIAMIENGLVEGTVDAHKLISEEIKQCKINIAILTTP